MADLTVWVSQPSVVCASVLRFLDQRGYDYTAIQVTTDEDRARMMRETGHQTCPFVVAGSEHIGGLEQTIEADKSGRLRKLLATSSIEVAPE